MNEDFEFSASYKVSKTFDDASNYDEQPPNPFDLPAERGLSRQDQRQRFVLNALWDLPFGEEEGQKAQQNRGWVVAHSATSRLLPFSRLGTVAQLTL